MFRVSDADTTHLTHPWQGKPAPNKRDGMYQNSGYVRRLSNDPLFIQLGSAKPTAPRCIYRNYVSTQNCFLASKRKINLGSSNIVIAHV